MTIHIIPDWQDYATRLPEFNDSVHQAQLFLSQGQAVELIVIDFLTHLNQILLHTALTETQVWSVYDVLQRVKLKADRPVAVTDLTWPTQAQFIYLPDRILVQVDDQLYATVWLDQAWRTRIVTIDLWTGDIRTQQLLVDYRGFVSRVTTFNAEGDKVRQDYLTPSGAVAVQEDCVSGAVTTQQDWTTQTQFKNMAELVVAALAHHLDQLPEQDNLIIAQSQRSMFLISQIDPKQPVILSYQAQRTNPQLAQALLLQLSGMVAHAVTDTQAQYDKIVAQLANPEQLAVIPPFSVQPAVLPTLQLPIAIIYWVADVLDVADFEAVRVAMTRQPEAIVFIETAQPHAEFDALIQLASQSATNAHGLVDDASQAAYKGRFQFIPPQNEAQRLQYMSNARVLLDLGETPDQFMQTAALTYAVPQINRTVTEYVLPEKNGQIVTDQAALEAALLGYLTASQRDQIVKETARELGQSRSDEYLWIKWQQVFNKIKQQRQSS